jgi:hypothetical protein
LLIASVGALITLILFGLFLFPVYMIEQRKGFDVNKRCLELSQKNWMLAIVPTLIITIPLGIASSIVSIVLAFIPFAGGVLVSVVNALTTSVLFPLSLLVQFRVYYAMVQQHENTDAAQIVRSRPAA